jgi:hypothetical protein
VIHFSILKMFLVRVKFNWSDPEYISRYHQFECYKSQGHQKLTWSLTLRSRKISRDTYKLVRTSIIVTKKLFTSLNTFILAQSSLKFWIILLLCFWWLCKFLSIWKTTTGFWERCYVSCLDVIYDRQYKIESKSGIVFCWFSVKWRPRVLFSAPLAFWLNRFFFKFLIFLVLK